MPLPSHYKAATWYVFDPNRVLPVDIAARNNAGSAETQYKKSMAGFIELLYHFCILNVYANRCWSSVFASQSHFPIHQSTPANQD